MKSKKNCGLFFPPQHTHTDTTTTTRSHSGLKINYDGNSHSSVRLHPTSVITVSKKAACLIREDTRWIYGWLNQLSGGKKSTKFLFFFFWKNVRESIDVLSEKRNKRTILCSERCGSISLISCAMCHISVAVIVVVCSHILHFMFHHMRACVGVCAQGACVSTSVIGGGTDVGTDCRENPHPHPTTTTTCSISGLSCLGETPRVYTRALLNELAVAFRGGHLVRKPPVGFLSWSVFQGLVGEKKRFTEWLLLGEQGSGLDVTRED